MEKSRIKNTIKNVKTGLIVQLVNKIMAFVVRTVFIRILNSEYLGVNGLFTNILSMLSFTELGIGTAIIFNMYKPVAENDKEKIKSLMKLYKISYNIIGVVIFILGLGVIPFFKYIIKEVPNIHENIKFIYILFLINTSSSYFFTYKKSIISAHQQESIINKIDSFFYLVKSIFEIAFLYLTKNYIVFLIVQIGGTILENIIIAKKAEVLFPYLKEKNVKKLKKEEYSIIFANVKALVVYQFGLAILSGTDNILISAMVNVATVGLCSNYTLIITSVKGVVLSAMRGVTASVGNLNAIETKEKIEEVFYNLIFVTYLIYVFCTVSFICLLNPFIKIWLGEKFVLNIGIPIALAFSFFVCGMRSPAYTYRVTLGLFEKGKTAPYIAAITNVVLSILFCKLWGVVGIFIATSVAEIVSYSIIDPYLIYKYKFKSSMKKYIVKMARYFLAFSLNVIICLYLTQLIKYQGYIGLVLKGVCLTIITLIFNVLLYYKTDEFKYCYDKFVSSIINRVRKKINREKNQ
ncbi:MAG TPA: sugar translocase [Clostridiales bacterium]|nr:sugar translocase [Clostridiales bacterium]